MMTHGCNNDICKLLNPCIDELLPYQEVIDRMAKVEEIVYGNIRKMKNMERFDMSGPFDFLDWASRHMIYQLPSKEFVYELSNKIKDIKPDKILEVGAGRGIISRNLGNVLNKEIILTDSYDWWNYKDREIDVLFPNVLRRTHIDAIEEFKPELIIASWIPYKKCWTKDFRKYPFVKGYIIIGEHKGGATGSEDDWNTDWKFQYLDDVEKYGICKTDHGFFMKNPIFYIRHTSVTYFERP